MSQAQGPAGAESAIPNRENLAEPQPGDALSALRSRIDDIDRQLLEVLAARVRACEEVAAVKSREEIPMMQPDRIAEVLRRVSGQAERQGVPLTFATRVFSAIIEETCRLEDRLMSSAGDSGGPGLPTSDSGRP